MKNNQLINADYIRHIVGVLKERFGKDTIALFHVAGNYECFLEDSALVSQALEIPQELYLEENGAPIHVTRFPAGELESCRKRLTTQGYATCTNETRGEDGTHILKIYEPEK